MAVNNDTADQIMKVLRRHLGEDTITRILGELSLIRSHNQSYDDTIRMLIERTNGRET